MNSLNKTIALAVLATAISGASALATDVTKRGPLPFSVWDTNNDGAISEDEFTDIRAKRQAARIAEGGQLRNAVNAPEFESIDKDGNGKLSKAEFATAQAAHRGRGKMGKGRGYGRHMGQGRGMGKGRGMGMGRGMGRGMGPRQAQ